jgi:hypothetical protein
VEKSNPNTQSNSIKLSPRLKSFYIFVWLFFFYQNY